MNRNLKTLASAVLLCCCAMQIHAQQKKSSLSITFGNAPADFKIGWYEIDNESFDNHDVKQSSFSMGIKYQGLLENNVSFRVRAGYSNINFYEYGDAGGSFTSAKSKQTKLQLAPGFIFSMTEKKFSLFGGIELPLYFQGLVTTDFIQRIDQASFNQRTTSTIPSGFMAGIAPLMGFTYDLTKRFFCEAEFSAMCLYGKTGGKTAATYADYVVNTEDALKGIFFEPRVAFGIGVRF